MVDVPAVAGAGSRVQTTREPFPSLLYAGGPVPLVASQPYFDDLNLTPVLDAVSTSAALRPHLRTLVDRASILLRHSVFRDLDANPALVRVVEAFVADMAQTRRLAAVSARVHTELEAMGWHLDACEHYLAAVHRLLAGLIAAQPQSAPLAQLTARLSVFVGEPDHARMADAVPSIRRSLDGLRYCVLVSGDHVSIRHYRGEHDYNLHTRQVLSRFLTGEPPDEFSRRFARLDAAPPDTRPVDLNAVEAQILAGVGRLFPDEFGALAEFCRATREVVDRRIASLEAELAFFTGYRAFMARITAECAPIAFCYPEIAEEARGTMWITDAHDVALALTDRRSAESPQPLVGNSIQLEPPEWAAIVSGPNQAGKTTFARMIGQIHHLAAIGVPVPARRARLRPVTVIHTHFERAQNAVSDRGRLADELARLADIMGRSDAQSLVILNDTLASTSRKDAQALGHAVLNRLGERCALCVYVSAVGTPAYPSEGAVSMVSGVDPDDPAQRTFRVERSTAPGTAYASALAAKYRLTYRSVLDRLRP